MGTCDQCRAALWEDLYGLVDAGAHDALHSHLEGCAACRAALARVRSQQMLIAEAARLEVEIPSFQAPRPESLPPAGRIRKTPLWPWVAAAAALLLAVSVPYGFFRAG